MEHRIFVSTGDSVTLVGVAASGTPVTITFEVIATNLKTDAPVGFYDNGMLPSFILVPKSGSVRTAALSLDYKFSETTHGVASMNPSSRWFGGDWLTVAW